MHGYENPAFLHPPLVALGLILRNAHSDQSPPAHVCLAARCNQSRATLHEPSCIFPSLCMLLILLLHLIEPEARKKGNWTMVSGILWYIRAGPKDPKDFMKTLSPMGVVSGAKDIADAVLYLTEARYVTGEVLHVDGGAHAGRW
jgi:Enoyl-(Acyl carrier protein) reductase